MPSEFYRPCICGTRAHDAPHLLHCPHRPDEAARYMRAPLDQTPIIGRSRILRFSRGEREK